MPTDSSSYSKLVSHLKGALDCLGHNSNSDSLKDTPERWAKYLARHCLPTHLNQVNSAPDLKMFAEATQFYSGTAVTQGPIPFSSTCEHHVLPFYGHAWVSYIPGTLSNREVGSVQYIYGLSKLARAVKFSALGLNTQERITNRIALLLSGENREPDFNKRPRGVAVVLKAEHMCMACRGVEVRGVSSVTQRLMGVFMDDSASRSEFYAIVNNLQP